MTLSAQAPTTDGAHPVPDRTKRVICKHCRKEILTVSLIGFSLICPACGKPQNGVMHRGMKSAL